MDAAEATTVALIGVRGFGQKYMELLTSPARAEHVRMVSGCDIAPDAAADLPPQVPFYTDFRAMLRECPADVVIVATPPHQHFEMARSALEAGSDVLMEKPPVVSSAEHTALLDVCRSRHRVCQIGFQNLVGAPMQRLLQLTAEGRLGEIRDIAVTGAWIRRDSYYRRSRWAGHRTLDGVVVADGAATNPFAHAVMNALAIAEAADPGAVPVRMEVESYRCRDIATDDTISARLDLSGGQRIHIALTLCAEEFADPVVTVHGTGAVAELGATATTLSVDGAPVELPADRGEPLDNLLAHLREGSPLLVPLTRTAAFTSFVESMVTSAPPHPVPADALEVHADDDGQDRRVVLRGINDVIAESGSEAKLFSEIGVPWAQPPEAIRLAQPTTVPRH
ncbi:Gfo/Idh/MocA family protein [Phytoactinopolyspora mesophila]|uniref:Gfo/Idh/MocA family oxidoreductase n=1 Tax=Phytoactinopolyspora mesophila TaxID=2650750 RepID=A0A7K3LZQ1_9ACTN|nr:Gfo/Idh/MocA family oxidoreductase [Phytoactinopolyspora mesophila]NDL56162.1 gfo/Idh/MocA family oxidoreductase [Phytoactinopolyspora mesophila]